MSRRRTVYYVRLAGMHGYAQIEREHRWQWWIGILGACLSLKPTLASGERQDIHGLRKSPVHKVVYWEVPDWTAKVLLRLRILHRVLEPIAKLSQALMERWVAHIERSIPPTKPKGQTAKVP